MAPLRLRKHSYPYVERLGPMKFRFPIVII
ncbi:MAG: hypothetical protein RLZZ409_525, partial [Pseudomonadota bacterium]